MVSEIEQIKSLDMVSVLRKYYGMTFFETETGFKSLSPFVNESDPSFIVRCVDNHWLFKDFSSGIGGSLLDFVMNKENINNIGRAVKYIKDNIKESEHITRESSSTFCSMEQSRDNENKKSYDIGKLYERIKGNDVSICKSYLKGRGICEEVIKKLMEGGMLLHNRHKEISYCCFAVFNSEGNLECLDNHQIDGKSKFVLGKKEVFTLDWQEISTSSEVFVCEGIIDYLSIKTSEGMNFCGIALLGSTVQFSPKIVEGARIILSAMDTDDAGVRGLLDLQEHLPDKEITVYQIKGDPNEYLKSLKSKKGSSNLSGSEKLELYKEFIKSKNKTTFTARHGISRAYMYEIVKECEKNIIAGYKTRQVGRKPKDKLKPSNLEEAWARIAELEEKRKEEVMEKERYYARSEFLKLRLKWSETENAELCGDTVRNPDIPLKNKQIKKKEKNELIIMLNRLEKEITSLGRCKLIKESLFSVSQVSKWLKQGVKERKRREPKRIPRQTAEKAVELIKKYPHISAAKGQAYMIYHHLGYIPQHLYKNIKHIVRRLVFQEVSSRSLLPAKTSYIHERADHVGEIWAEDFTTITVYGRKFYLSVVIDVKSTYYLGAEVSSRADISLVESPVIQALEENNNKPPKRFLLSDNGSQYISEEHGKLLDSSDIVHKRIPACVPQYNGSVECGIKEFKNVFYNVWAEMDRKEADKEKNIQSLVKKTVKETRQRMNVELPRPCLGGVTPSDVHFGKKEEKLKINQTYLEQEKNRGEVKPWTKDKWKLIKEKLFERPIDDLTLMTKFCFFLKRPLRKLTIISSELSGNF